MSNRDQTTSSNPNDSDNFPVWSPDEQNTLSQNMTNYPEDNYSEFKRLTLLLTNLPHKRLRDVAARVEYLKELETNPQLTWQQFCRNQTIKKQRRYSITTLKHSPRSSSRSSDIEDSVQHTRKKSKERIKEKVEVEKRSCVTPSVTSFTEKAQLPITYVPVDPPSQSPPLSSFSNASMPSIDYHHTTQQSASQIPTQVVAPKIVMEQEVDLNGEDSTNVQQQYYQEEMVIDNVSPLLGNIDMVLNALMEREMSSNEIDIDLIQQFHTFFNQIVEETTDLAQPLQLPFMFNVPCSVEEINSLNVNPELINGGFFNVNQVNMKQD
ncbi:Uncharacterized protein QTN25_010848 [Entamoeba marina]